ncbi:DUF498-domain-containing protein [Mycena albidolilacea]|uniref:DUF498-domain-containing protein n=1 Tax=Mycena albidolilacea TaxID=1033008 RepID=A0AAD7F7P6_9AGAR|nr:DUF498-domain-containing protein [Mycena albidolilacea]
MSLLRLSPLPRAASLVCSRNVLPILPRIPPALAPIARRRALHTTRPLLDRTPSLTNMLASGTPPAMQVASLTPTGIHLEDGLLIPSACIFLDGTVFLWDPPASVTAWGREHLRVFEAVVPRPEILVLGTGAEMAHPPPSVQAYLAGLGIQVEVMSTRNACSAYNLLARA